MNVRSQFKYYIYTNRSYLDSRQLCILNRLYSNREKRMWILQLNCWCGSISGQHSFTHFEYSGQFILYIFFYCCKLVSFRNRLEWWFAWNKRRNKNFFLGYKITAIDEIQEVSIMIFLSREKTLKFYLHFESTLSCKNHKRNSIITWKESNDCSRTISVTSRFRVSLSLCFIPIFHTIHTRIAVVTNALSL